jgi:hypothetical protein
VGASLRIPRAGAATDERGASAHASLLDATATLARAADTVRVGPGSGAGTGEIWPWIVVAAMLLLGAEWWLVRKERMP